MKASKWADPDANMANAMKNRIHLFVPAFAAASAWLALVPAAGATDIYGTITFKGTPQP